MKLGAFRDKGSSNSLPYRCGVCRAQFAIKKVQQEHSKTCKDTRGGQRAARVS